MSATALPDQKDVLAELTGMKDALAKAGITLPDLISQHASMTANKAAVDAAVANLTGDKSKLVAGANLPTDLVSAGNEIASLKAEVASLKAAATTVEQAAAAKIVQMGFTNAPKGNGTGEQAQKPKTLTDKVLEAKGCKTLAEAETKFREETAKNPTA